MNDYMYVCSRSAHCLLEDRLRGIYELAEAIDKATLRLFVDGLGFRNYS